MSEWLIFVICTPLVTSLTCFQTSAQIWWHPDIKGARDRKQSDTSPAHRWIFPSCRLLTGQERDIKNVSVDSDRWEKVGGGLTLTHCNQAEVTQIHFFLALMRHVIPSSRNPCESPSCVVVMWLFLCVLAECCHHQPWHRVANVFAFLQSRILRTHYLSLVKEPLCFLMLLMQMTHPKTYQHAPTLMRSHSKIQVRSKHPSWACSVTHWAGDDIITGNRLLHIKSGIRHSD